MCFEKQLSHTEDSTLFVQAFPSWHGLEKDSESILRKLQLGNGELINVTLTGGAGYIGATLIPLLLNQGYRVTCFDCLSDGASSLLPYFRFQNFELVCGDIRRADQLAPVFRSADVIIHLAAVVGYPACDRQPDLARDINVHGSHIVNECRQREQLVIYACTGSVYGQIHSGICTEQTPAIPTSLYAKTKLDAERLFLEKGNCISLRIATAFGLSPSLRTDILINSLCLLALRERRLVLYEGHARRTFLHVHDIARAIVHALENADKLRDGVYNCGVDGLNLSKIEVARRICQLLEIEIVADGAGHDPDRRDYWVSHERWKATGYRPAVTIEDGIREMLAAFVFLPPAR